MSDNPRSNSEVDAQLPVLENPDDVHTVPAIPASPFATNFPRCNPTHTIDLAEAPTLCGSVQRNFRFDSEYPKQARRVGRVRESHQFQLEEARDQIEVAAKTKIEWVFSTQEAADAVAEVFENKGIFGIAIRVLNKTP